MGDKKLKIELYAGKSWLNMNLFNLLAIYLTMLCKKLSLEM